MQQHLGGHRCTDNSSQTQGLTFMWAFGRLESLFLISSHTTAIVPLPSPQINFSLLLQPHWTSCVDFITPSSLPASLSPPTFLSAQDALPLDHPMDVSSGQSILIGASFPYLKDPIHPLAYHLTALPHVILNDLAYLFNYFAVCDPLPYKQSTCFIKEKSLWRPVSPSLPGEGVSLPPTALPPSSLL